jgi:hypothetical protein
MRGDKREWLKGIEKYIKIQKTNII